MTESTNSSHELLVDIGRLAGALRQFARDRNWEQFHSPKNLVMALTGETGELTELFQWLSEEQSHRVCDEAEAALRVEHELADVLFYLVRLADVLGVDLNQAAQRKLQLNSEKYPVERSFGSNKKYDQF